MTVGTVAQDRTVKLPVPESVLGVEGAEDGGGNASLFGELMAQLVGEEAKDQSPAGEAAIDELIAQASPEAQLAVTAQASGPLQELLANALSTIVQDVKADLQVTVAADASRSGDVLQLAQLIAKSAQAQDGASGVAMPDGDGKDMKGVEAVLEAWADGPYAVAAPTTGAKEKRPMDMAVVNVETHFAPVVAADAEVSAELKGPTIALPSDVKRDGGAALPKTEPQPAAAAALATAKSDTGSQQGFGDSRSDTGSRDQPQATQDVPTVATEHKTAAVSVDAGAQSGQPVSAVKQLASEIARSVAGVQPTGLHPLDVKPGLSKLKVLHIQLQPESLGSLTVRMSLRADMLELHIDAARAETADLIQRDREVLSSLLRAVGYTADDAQIRITHADPSVTATMAANGDSGMGSSSQSGAQAGSQTPGERSSGSQERDGNGGRREQNDHGARSDREAQSRGAKEASGIYL
ncbi:MAG: flagellar hook-length control protein FliK [Hyphomicrobiaceae bacterium]|nr:flagellar hook-length control protein FliK [Hyphomicrobiaceae bacterium]